jgi:23S rRNA pseudouridine2605 synthase
VRVRVQRILARAGLASRREAEALLRAGRVSVNGSPVGLGASADPERDRIELDGEPVRAEMLDYWLVHKPRGALTTRRDPEGRPTVLDLLPAEARARRLFPVGRLDRESEGLVLLTNDGALAERVLHPSWGCEKEYRVKVRGRVSPRDAERLERGVWLAEGRTAPARVFGLRYDARRDTTSLSVVLREGRNRQIRRMLARQGLRAERLARVRIGPLALGPLARGAARRLRPAEVAALRDHAGRLSRARRAKAAAGAGPAKRQPKPRKHIRRRKRSP